MTLSIWNELIGADIRFIKGEKYTSRIAEAGQEHRETLIMTHGGGGHLETFARNVIPLAKDLHTIGLEILWHGLSDAPEISDNPQAQVADQIIDLMDAMNIDKAWVHGEAYSGSAVSWLARTQPERLKGVIFESGIEPISLYLEIFFFALDKALLDILNGSLFNLYPRSKLNAIGIGISKKDITYKIITPVYESLSIFLQMGFVVWI